MLTTWLGGLGSKLAEGWAGRALSPAFLFWLGGFGAVAFGPDGARRVADATSALNGAPAILQVLAIGGAVALVAVSEQLSKGLALGVMRLLEGYWPMFTKPVRGLLVGSVSRARAKDRISWSALNEKIDRDGAAGLTAEDGQDYSGLELRLHRVPSAVGLQMPTRFGNTLRAAEIRIAGRYGLDPVLSWPSYWLVLPELARTELANARAALDADIQTWLWAVLFCLWAAVLWWWPPLVAGLIVAVVTYYGWLLPAAATYGDLLEAVYGLHRVKLYEAFGRKMPCDLTEERAAGFSLTQLIWHGPVEAPANVSDGAARPPESA